MVLSLIERQKGTAVVMFSAMVHIIKDNAGKGDFKVKALYTSTGKISNKKFSATKDSGKSRDPMVLAEKRF